MNLEEIRAQQRKARERIEALRDLAKSRTLSDDESREAEDQMALFERLGRQAAMTEYGFAGEAGEDRDGDRVHGRSTRESLPAHASAARSQALRGVENISDRLDNAAAKRLETLIDESVNTPGALDARYISAVADPAYSRAFGKLLVGDPATAHLRMQPEELEALQRANTPEFRSITSTQSGYAVPADIDPTVLNISNGALNPFREMARVVTTTAAQWKGITSAGITASYDSEASEVSDDTPTLAQAPSITVEKAQSLVTFSIEADQDWTALREEIAREFADAKDVLEESKFTTGAGHGSNEPKGIITGATVTTTLATSVSPVIDDFFSTVDLLPPRWQQDAAWLMTPRLVNKVQQLVIATGAGGLSSFGDLASGPAAHLINYPLYRGTTIDSAWQTAGKKIAVYGSFKRAFVIVDRIGMSVELVPHIFNTTNNLPDGRRGLYAYWRNSSDVVTPNAFVVLKTS